MTSAKLGFFALLQVIVFEEQETDGKIQFTSSPDYGMSVDVQWGEEVRVECGWEEDDGRAAGEDVTEAFSVSFVYVGADASAQPAALKIAHTSVNLTFCVMSDPSNTAAIQTGFSFSQCIHDVVSNPFYSLE